MNSFEHHYFREMRVQEQRDRFRREERNRRQWEEECKRNRLNVWLALILAVLVAVLFFLTVTGDRQESEPDTLTHGENVHLSAAIVSLDSVEAQVAEPQPVAQDPVAKEPVTFEDWFRENANRIDDCQLTHYCSEKRAHVCGTGDGITATGVPVTPYWTCAVDKNVIPYGAVVMVDYGDRVEFWKAQDCGASVDGKHLDLAVTTHDEAMELGIKQASVYWLMEDEIAHF
jgi:3D (Asp-Asp-Asp) domain-containing protein